MKKILLLISFMLFSISPFTQAPDEFESTDAASTPYFFNPLPNSATADGCIRVLWPEQWAVPKGTIIVINFQECCPYPSDCPAFTSSCTTSNPKVIKKHPIGERIFWEAPGALHRTGFFFKAINRGESSITLCNNEHVFNYYFTIY